MLQETEKSEKKESVKENYTAASEVAELVEKLDSNVSTNGLNVKLVPRNKIQFHKKNDYSQNDIESLAESLLKFGIQNIPSGFYDEENDKYVSENGERRIRAIDSLIKRFESANKESADYQLYLLNIAQYVKGYPFHIILKREMDEEVTPIDEIDSELRLIDANEISRDDEEERKAHILRKIELLNEKNRLLGNNEINIVAQIAKDEDISKRQAYKYNAANSLIPELRDMFVKNKMTLNDSEFYSKLTPEEQAKIVELIESGSKGNASELYELQQKLDEEQKKAEKANKKIADLMRAKEIAESTLAKLEEKTQKDTDQSVEEIKLQLEEEYKKLNEGNTEEQRKTISNLESELKNLNISNENLRNRKENEITALNEKIEKLQQAVANANSGDVLAEKIKAETAYKISIETIHKDIKDLKATVTVFLELDRTDTEGKKTIVANVDSLVNALTQIKRNLTK